MGQPPTAGVFVKTAMNRSGARAEDLCAELLRGRRAARAGAQLALPPRRDRPDRRGGRHAGVRRGAHAQQRPASAAPPRASPRPSARACWRRRACTCRGRREAPAASTCSCSTARAGARAMDPQCVWRIAPVALALLACAEALAQAQARRAAAGAELAARRLPLPRRRARSGRSCAWATRSSCAREPDNPHDANAVRVSWRGRKLGYVPRRENAARRVGPRSRRSALRARISRLAPHPNPARRIEFEVYAE